MSSWEEVMVEGRDGRRLTYGKRRLNYGKRRLNYGGKGNPGGAAVSGIEIF